MSEECDVLLRDGGIAHVRPLAPGDRAALHDLVDRTSEGSAYLRFFTGGRGTAHAHMDRITGPGHEGRVLLATVRDRPAAIAEYTPAADPSVAEMAILIDDAAQGQGLGTLLLEHLAVRAAEAGVRELVGEVLAENRAMLGVLRDLGLPVDLHFDGGLVHLRIGLDPDDRLLDRVAARDHEAERASLARVLAPASIAVVGAGRDPSGAGHKVLRNLLDGGFPGPVYPVNPKAARVAGVTAYPDLGAVPGPVDLAVIAVPAPAVLDVARDCAAAGVKGLVVLTAGFAENGGRAAERALVAICRSAGMRMIGPNCLGIVNTAARMNATFLTAPVTEGSVAVLSQSGAVGAALLDRLPVSSFVSVGNKADVSGNDLLDHWEDDEATRVIALYLESFGNPRKFARIAARVGRRKPVLLVKSGRSGAGDRAVASHTAAAATPDVAVDALVRAAGVIRLDSVRDMLDTARLLTAQPLPAGRRVAIVGNSGGPEAMTADACEREGLVVPELALSGSLAGRVPAAAALGNPVDLTADASAEEIGLAVESALARPDVDAVLIVYTPPFGSGLEATAKAIAEAARASGKTVVACVMGQDGAIEDSAPAIPVYAFPEQAVQALARAAAYAEWLRTPPDRVERASVEADWAAKDIVRAELAARPEGGWLDPDATERLLRAFGVTVAESIIVEGPWAAGEAAAAFGTPVVLKATGLVHKSDVGGVRVGLATPGEVRQAYREMAAEIGPVMTGAIVQRMVPPGVEIIVGGVNYPAFGPLLMTGMGGVTADLLADRAFRVPPVSADTAAEMIADLRCSPLLYGYRGGPRCDTAALADQITRVGRLLDALPEVAELDLNPVIVTPGGAVAVDARVRLAPCAPAPSPYARRLR
ncbi:bifunctional acetate--CoA ligase family protein/GNAT family N-acetyltransferase [Sphaerisporangium krabiense]|uniref:Acyl-CoA synthetase (NDP forming)/GNAT superfamily N-acetyltransferase n=1 Tax=Sphaerisporangium krabiense TaxID=763782 RepID=A0A7W8Z2E6_9ACTN|nr:GNAT family N-acetyltransferase [Sphaerisporangium krabiense]MBB5626206.1 acyl-CoA synthetase (NDP forming)/GNAT superfamily N-acetyltransferase [Sphaerisporangium krabiense]